LPAAGAVLTRRAEGDVLSLTQTGLCSTFRPEQLRVFCQLYERRRKYVSSPRLCEVRRGSAEVKQAAGFDYVARGPCSSGVAGGRPGFAAAGRAGSLLTALGREALRGPGVPAAFEGGRVSDSELFEF
jgi:hypothetical protein